MRVEFVELRRNGVKISKEQLEGPFIGCLTIGSWTLSEPGGETRMVREASLRRDYFINEPCLVDPLQDAVVTKVTQAGMIIVGLQRSTPGGPMHKQAWWIKPL